MRQTSRSTGLLQEALTITKFVVEILTGQGDGLNGHIAVDFRIAGAVHNSHGAATDFALDAVSSQGIVRMDFHKMSNLMIFRR
jgi:hypothetical protein